MDLKKSLTLSDRIRKAVVDVVLSSTGHGFPNIIRSNNFFIKFMWIFFTILSSSFCIFLITESILSYFKYEVTTKTRVINEIMAIFPTVTVCNMNYFTSIYSLKFIEAFKSEMNAKINPLSTLFETIAKMHSKEEKFTFLKENYGDSLDKLVVYCQYNYEDCNLTDFKFFLHPNYGNCYQFNSGFDSHGKKNDLKYAMTTERLSGLRLILNISVTQKLKFMNPSTGAVIFIHNHTTYPMMVDTITLAPKTETSISLSRTFYESKQKPYSNCDAKTNDMNSYNSEYYKLVHENTKAYGQTLCIHQCIQKFFIENCDCFVADYPCFYNSMPCNLTTWQNCIGIAFQYIKKGDYLNQECEQKCPLECQRMWFDKTVSTNEFSNSMYEDFLQEYDGSDSIYFNQSFDSKDFAVVNVYYGNLGFISVSESPTTDVVGLLSNIGGVAGLFLGISLLTFVEILEIIINIIFVLKNRKINIVD
ncbi:amiloride-sensitive sodium channel subunit beta [Brachionus plicatilis]|uniref:Amiloride-sensitive sodium channel subunit beta n=1 Tax=Brachionus plicatilis TaxID=10195 RepID=A0A3M7SFH8_BRAPC|nr:amiloride-sensitive sodium channel subunit beta [Brachionus plicatilis]